MGIKKNNRLSISVVLSSLIVYTLGILFTVIIGSILSILFPLRHIISPHIITKLVVLWASLNLGTLNCLCQLDYKLYGRGNLLQALSLGKGVVVASNHQSAWDILACIHIFNKATFLIKKSLLKVPFFGWGLAMLKPVAIDRKKRTNAMSSLLEQGTERLKEGYIFVAFPEGTRQPMRTIGTYNVGSILLATKTGTPILPMVHNAGDFWARKSPWRFPGTVQAVIGEPIDSTKYDPRELTKQIEQWSRKQLELMEQGCPQPDLKINLPTNPKERL